MSQQSLQQEWTYQFRNNTATEKARVGGQFKAGRNGKLPWQGLHSKIRRNFSPTLLACLVMGAAVSLLVLASLYISANALTAKIDYQRQTLLKENSALREQNATLRCRLDQAADLARISKLASAVGMRPADPATESDFLSLTPGQTSLQASNAWFSKGPKVVAKLNRKIDASYSSGRAEASPAKPELPALQDN